MDNERDRSEEMKKMIIFNKERKRWGLRGVGVKRERFKDDITERTPPFLTPNNSWRNPQDSVSKFGILG